MSVLKERQYRVREREYLRNEEKTAAVEAKIDGHRYFFDATRRLEQYGAYINHSINPNIRPFPPVFVRGKYRFGFLAMRDISPGEELTWDYNTRDPKWPWLSGLDPPKAEKGKLIFVSGCFSFFPIQQTASQSPPMSKCTEFLTSTFITSFRLSLTSTVSIP